MWHWAKVLGDLGKIAPQPGNEIYLKRGIMQRQTSNLYGITDDAHWQA